MHATVEVLKRALSESMTTSRLLQHGTNGFGPPCGLLKLANSIGEGLS